MKKRDFFKIIGMGFIAGAVSGPVLGQVGGAPAAAAGSPNAGAEQDFKSLAALEVKISDMVNDRSRTVLVTSTRPIVIPEAKLPLAVMFSENDDETVRMTVFSKRNNDKWVETTYSFAGMNSSQVLRGYGVILDLYAHL